MKVRKHIIFILFTVIVAIIFGTVQKGGTTPVVVSSINYSLDANVTLYRWDHEFSGGTGAEINKNMTPSGQLFQFQDQNSRSVVLGGGTAYADTRIEGLVNIGDTFQMIEEGTISVGFNNTLPQFDFFPKGISNFKCNWKYYTHRYIKFIGIFHHLLLFLGWPTWDLMGLRLFKRINPLSIGFMLW